MTSTEDAAPPKLFEHVCRVFQEMRRNAVSHALGDSEEATHMLVYEGYLTHLFRDLGLPTPYYTSVMERLKVMGCVRQLGRGGGTSPSRWELIEDPDFDAFQEAEDNKRKSPGRLEQVEIAVRELQQGQRRLEKLLSMEDTQPEPEAASG
jgi:hypothetical protein